MLVVILLFGRVKIFMFSCVVFLIVVFRCGLFSVIMCSLFSGLFNVFVMLCRLFVRGKDRLIVFVVSWLIISFFIYILGVCNRLFWGVKVMIVSVLFCFIVIICVFLMGLIVILIFGLLFLFIFLLIYSIGVWLIFFLLIIICLWKVMLFNVWCIVVIVRLLILFLLLYSVCG